MRMRRVVIVGGALAVVLLLLLLPQLAWAAGSAPAAEFQAELESRGLFLTYLACFGFGIMASLTPCVYPMIPIVVGVFGARDDAVTRRRAFALATAYVLGLGAVFSALGLTFAFIGESGDQGEVLANPWIVWPIVLIYAALAASMFGAFELNLPSGLQQRLARVGGKGYGGAFGMGMVGGFTAAPCTGPFLAGLLAWVAVKGSPLVGSTMLFTFALGMGVLFWVIAATSVSLPKSGRWMEWVKSVGGIALIVVGIYFLRPVVPGLLHLEIESRLIALACLVAVAIGFAIGAMHLSFGGHARDKLRKGAGVLLVAGGAAGIMFWVLTVDRKLPWRTDEAVAFAEAKQTGKGVMIDFSATWCKPCGKLENDTFAEPRVFDKIVDGYVPLKFDVTNGTDLDEARKQKYGQSTMPEVILLDASGRILERVRDYVGPDVFLGKLHAAEKARERAPQTAAAR
jgi:thioredoxin:protein disulfide reductase